MNILQINTDNATGGAGRAASRLYTGLKELGEISRMIVRTRIGQDVDIQTPPRAGLLGQGVEYVLKRLYRYGSLHYLYYPSMRALLRHSWVREADVINLHNIHGNYFAYPILPKLTHLKPVVWTLHDMWSFTGHCSYSYNCQRWQAGCGQCPDLDVYPQIRHDTTRLQWQIKSYLYQRSRLTIVTPSHWLASLACSSPLLGRFQVRCIPNSVDTNIYQPMEREAVRYALGLPADKIILIFIAAKLQDTRKGGDLLIAVLQKLAAQTPSPNLAVAMLGEGSQVWEKCIPFPVFSLGTISSEKILAACYSAADLLVLPTRMDNLPNSLLESMACGIPCVSFDIGGVSDAVRHMETGYLAQAEATDDMAQGISYFLNDADLRRKCQENCRSFAVQEYSLRTQAKRYLELYQSLVKTI